MRPLYQEGFQGESRDATRALTLLDHRQRDGVAGFLTITGGKWTTFRLMAEVTVDKACEQLGGPRPCRTADTPVPGVEQGYYWLGHRLHEVEEHRLQGELVCECELVTRSMLEQAALKNPTVSLDDLRRDVRLGMGPCQGGFCTYRAVGILHELAGRAADAGGRQRSANQRPGRRRGTSRTCSRLRTTALVHMPARRASPRSVGPAPQLLRDFLQERWRGVTPILWGRQLKQERLDELVYLSVLNADHLPPRSEPGPLSAYLGIRQHAGRRRKRRRKRTRNVTASAA